MLIARRSPLALLAAGALLGPFAAGCGVGEGGQPGGDDRPSGQGNTGERAFLEAMVPHHQAAVEMSEIAMKRAKAPEIQRLAGEILAAQKAEVAQMGTIHQRLFGAELKPNEGAHEVLGLSAEEAGMDHMDAARKLMTADPVERAFIAEMVPHHRGAIRMAETVLAHTRDPELRELAEHIVSVQRKEIGEMNAFAEARLGGPAPGSGGGHDEPAPDSGGGHGEPAPGAGRGHGSAPRSEAPPRAPGGGRSGSGSGGGERAPKRDGRSGGVGATAH